MIKCSELGKSHKKKLVVNNLDFSKKVGFAFLGSNCTGKTTTIYRKFLTARTG